MCIALCLQHAAGQEGLQAEPILSYYIYVIVPCNHNNNNNSSTDTNNDNIGLSYVCDAMLVLGYSSCLCIGSYVIYVMCIVLC